MRQAECAIRSGWIHDSTFLAERYLVELLARYPNSDYRPRADVLLCQVREVRAMHELKIARFYFYHRAAYKASAARARSIVEKYPCFSHVGEALRILRDSLFELGEYDEADDYFGRNSGENLALEHGVTSCSALDENERLDIGAFDLDRDGVIVKADGGSSVRAGVLPAPF